MELPAHPPMLSAQVQVEPPLNLVSLFVKVTVNCSVVVPPSSGYEPPHVPSAPLMDPVKTIPPAVTTKVLPVCRMAKLTVPMVTPSPHPVAPSVYDIDQVPVTPEIGIDGPARGDE